MQLRYAEKYDEAKLKALWELCFPGEMEFSDLFFSEIYRPENALVCVDGSEISAMLHMIPCEMDHCGRRIPVSYVYGGGTHPDYRKKGLAAALIEQAFFEMHLRRVALSVLIPQNDKLFEYYKKLS